MGCSIVNTRAYYKKGGINTKVAIGARVGIRVSSNKDIFRLFLMPLSLYRALSVYSGGVNK
jgi:hypothetical protein